MLRQAIREMEDAISRTLDGAARTLAAERVLRRDLERREESTAVWLAAARRALARGEREGAREAIRRKRAEERIARALDGEIHRTGESAAALREQVEAMRERLAEARRKLETLVTRRRVASARRSVSGRGRGARDAFAKYERLRARVDLEVAEAEAAAELFSPPDDLARRLADEEEERAVDAELEALDSGSAASAGPS
jgi:phage shock protein A